MCLDTELRCSSLYVAYLLQFTKHNSVNSAPLMVAVSMALMHAKACKSPYFLGVYLMHIAVLLTYESVRTLSLEVS